MKKEEIIDAIKIDNDTIIELDDNDNILGIEIINVTKKLSKDFYQI